jgi:Putative restriction endonuclease
MTAVILDSTANTNQPEIFHPISDGASDHLCAIMTTLEMIQSHLKGQQVTVLAAQFLYYVQEFPRLRVATDVMVIVGVEPGGRDNYKIWEEGRVPSVIFEITSLDTRSEDDVEKKYLYESLGVKEYWQFDPNGEWIPEKLRGYRIQGDEEPVYVSITNDYSEVLQLHLMVEDKIIAFYPLDDVAKLLPLTELNIALEQQTKQLEAETQRAEAESQRADREAQRTRELEAQIALYQQRLSELSAESPTETLSERSNLLE